MLYVNLISIKIIILFLFLTYAVENINAGNKYNNISTIITWDLNPTNIKLSKV